MASLFKQVKVSFGNGINQTITPPTKIKKELSILTMSGLGEFPRVESD